MGLLDRIIGTKSPQAEYLPAERTVPATTGTGLQSTANAALDRAGRFYRENPKMVAGLGVAAALVALSALKRRQF